MRITNGMMSRNLLNNLGLNMRRMNKLNQQAASGKKFDRPSDDPVAMAKSLKIYTDVSRVNQYERNVRDAESWLHTTENAMHEMGEILQRTRELAVYMANGTNTESDTQKTAEEIKQLKDQMIKLANTTHAGRSVFTGYQTDKELMDKNGNYLIDLSQEEVSIYNVGIAETLEVNTLGSKLFGVKSKSEVVFEKIDGDNDLSIDIGEANLALGDIEIEIFNGSQEKDDNDVSVHPTSKAEWSGKKLTITIGEDAPNDIDSAYIKDLITNATGWDVGDFEVTPDPGTLDRENISNKTIATGGINVENSAANQKSHLIDVFDQLIAAMSQDAGDVDEGGIEANFDQKKVGDLIGELDLLIENKLTLRAELGAKTNRLEMTSKRLSSEKLNFTSVLSANEDVDQAEVIMHFKMAEAVYNASLAMGGRSIQPTLVDFLR